MIINFEVPSGYSYPEADGSETNVIPRKGDYMDIYRKGTFDSVELQVRKVCFSACFERVEVILVEED